MPVLMKAGPLEFRMNMINNSIGRSNLLGEKVLVFKYTDEIHFTSEIRQDVFTVINLPLNCFAGKKTVGWFSVCSNEMA